MSNYTLTASLLDSLTIGMCVFDAQDRTVLWNEHFLRFFPEHADHIHAGEPYQENLRRFYRVRLPAEPQASIERYVQDGIKRHRSQVGAYMFTHRGRQLRVWQDLSAMESVLLNLAGQQDSALPQGVGPTGQQALRMFDQLSDGMAVHDEQGRIIFANDRFLAIYGLRTQGRCCINSPEVEPPQAPDGFTQQ